MKINNQWEPENVALSFLCKCGKALIAFSPVMTSGYHRYHPSIKCPECGGRVYYDPPRPLYIPPNRVGPGAPEPEEGYYPESSEIRDWEQERREADRG